MVPPGEGNEARGDGRRGVGVSQSTAEAGELSPRDPVEGRGHRQVAPVEGKDGQHTEVGSRLHVTTTDSRTGQISLGDGGGHRLASWTSGYATARSEAICRGAGCGRTRTSGSVGGRGQQRPWSTRPASGARLFSPAWPAARNWSRQREARAAVIPNSRDTDSRSSRAADAAPSRACARPKTDPHGRARWPLRSPYGLPPPPIPDRASPSRHSSCENSLAIKCPRKPWGAGRWPSDDSSTYTVSPFASVMDASTAEPL